MTEDVKKFAPGDLMRAVGDAARVKELIAAGADVNEKIGYMTPILSAAKNGTPETMRLLLENDARTDHVSEFDWTPLHTAAVEGHVEMVRLLLDAGADIEARDQDGMTPLISAARFGHIDVVQTLLEHGAFLDAKDKGLGTARSRAAGWNQSELVKLLELPVEEWPRVRSNASAREAFNAAHGIVVEKQRALRRRAPKFRPT